MAPRKKQSTKAAEVAHESGIGDFPEAEFAKDVTSADPQPEPSEPLHIPKVFIIYQYTTKDGHTAMANTFIDNYVDVRTAAQVRSIEELLRQNGDFTKVVLIDWKRLEG